MEIKNIIRAILFLILIGTAMFSADFLSDGGVLAKKSSLPKLDLIKGDGPEVYLLENGTRHWIPSIEVFNSFRFKWENVKKVSNLVLETYPQADDWKKNDEYPNGSLLRGSGYKVYLIESEKKRWIPTANIFEGSDFGWKYIINVDDEILEDFDNGDDLTLAESDKYPETIILSGPDQSKTINTSEVTFKYSGTNPLGSNSDLKFETYLAGYDTKWQNQGSKYEKTYNLSKEEDKSKVYIFYVRAINEQEYIDASPVSWKFSIGLSSNYGKIEIDDAEIEEDNFKEEYLVLVNESEEAISVSGWTLESKTDYTSIPQAIKNLSYSFSTKEYSDIILNHDDELIVSMGKSPNGINFRVNKCSGYFNNSYTFYPSLDENCPELDESEYSHLKKTCRDFIEDLDKCEVPNYSSDHTVNGDSQCTSFLNAHFNYSGCYTDYYQDIDFFESEWRVFINKSVDIFNDYTDKIILKDNGGMVVDEYEY